MTSPPASGGSDAAARSELRWALLVAAVVALMLGMISFTAVHYSSMPPSRVEVVDATRLNSTGEFVENNLGTGVDSSGRVVVRVLAQEYAFRPACLVVPEGVPVTFRATASDVVHGFQIQGTNLNTMLIPGYISTFSGTLQGQGERVMPCHEYCGAGHASMWARVKVISRQQFEQMLREHKRVSCV